MMSGSNPQGDEDRSAIEHEEDTVSSAGSANTQAGVKEVEAISLTWTRWLDLGVR